MQELSDAPPPTRDQTNWRSVVVRLVVVAGVLFVCGYYAASALHYADMPLRIEESEWPPMAAAIFDTGKPIITADETHRVRFTPALQTDPSPLIGAWHPPLYLYALAAAMPLVGSEASNGLRIVGVLGLLISALLLLLIAREVTPRWRLIGGVAASLLLIHPYTIQGSVFLDIDNTIYAPLVLLVMWLTIRFGARDARLSPAQIAAIGGALALVTWAKMTTTVVLVGVLVVWWLLTRRPLVRAIGEAVGFVAVGAALFFSSYALWCEWSDIPFSYTFDVTFVQKSDRLLSDWWIADNAAHWHLRWFGAALVVLSLAYIVDLVHNLLVTRRLRPLDLPYLFALGVLVNYVLLSPTDGTYQGKYAIPAVATLLLPITWMLLRDERAVRGSVGRWAAAAAIAAAAAVVFPDMLTNLSVNGIYGNWDYDLLIVLGAGATLAGAWMVGGRSGFGGGVVLVLALMLVSQGVRSYRSDHSPMYPVPDTVDFRAAAADLNARTGPQEIVVAPKDLGFYVVGPVVEGEDAFARGDSLMAAAIRTNPRIVAFARDSFGPPVGPETAAVVDACFLDRKAFGSVSLAYRSGSCD